MPVPIPALLMSSVTSPQLRSGRGDVGRGGDVELHGDDAGVVEAVEVARAGVHLGRASVEERAAERGAEASVGAGDEGDGSFDLHVGSPVEGRGRRRATRRRDLAGVGSRRGGGAHRQDERGRGESTDDDEPPDRVEAVDDGAGGAEEGDGEGDAEGAAELADGLGGGAADAGTAGWQCLGDDAGELREDERDAEAAEQHRREEVAQRS